MSGFPTRILRSFFGPRLKNAGDVEDPETEVGERTLNLAFDQVAGMNLLIPRSVTIAEWGTDSFDIKYRAEAWNIEGDQTHPVLARTATGEYTLTFASSYLNGEGSEVPISLTAARISVEKELTDATDRVRADVWVEGLVVHIRLWDSTDAATDDAKFWVEVF